MSGNIATLASYNATGTQGSAVVDSPEKSGEIISTIWNRNDTTRQLIIGTALKEITPAGVVSTELNNSTTIFTIARDVDVIGDMYLHIAAEAMTGEILHASNNGFYNSISKIQVLIGSQVWQTITPAQLNANLIFQSMSMRNGTIDMLNYDRAAGVGPNLATWNMALPLIGMFTNTVTPINSNFIDQINNGYLMAAASNQEMHIKVFWSDGNNIIGPTEHAFNTRVTLKSCRLYCKQSMLSNFERQQIQTMVLPKRVIMSQTVNQNVTLKSGKNDYTFNINCDPFNIFASAIVVDLNNHTLSEACRGLLGSIELLLNGSSFSGPIVPEILSIYGGHLLNSTTERPGLVIPLSNSLYGSGVPLNRFDSIRIRLVLPSANFHEHGSDNQDILSATAIGQSTVIYSGGSASINKF